MLAKTLLRITLIQRKLFYSILHAYNGTQNLMAQGKHFENLAINFLEAYFSEKFDELDDRNVSFNAQVQNVLGIPNAKIKK